MYEVLGSLQSFNNNNKKKRERRGEEERGGEGRAGDGQSLKTLYKGILVVTQWNKRDGS